MPSGNFLKMESFYIVIYVSLTTMTTIAAAREDLRIAELVLQIATDNGYLKVIPYLEVNVIKAQKVLVSLEGHRSPSEMLLEAFGILPPPPKKVITRTPAPLHKIVTFV